MLKQENKTFITDPNGKYTHVNESQILNALGILPFWAIKFREHNNSFKQALKSSYQFYFGDLKGCTIQEDGSYTYPGDPVMHPLAVMTAPDCPETLYFYEHAVVGVVNSDTGEQWMTRMD